MAQLAYTRETANGRRTMRLTYRGVILSFSWQETEEGNADLVRFLKHMPDILQEWKDEMAVREELAGMDAELDNLLGDGE